MCIVSVIGLPIVPAENLKVRRCEIPDTAPSRTAGVCKQKQS